MGVYIPYTSYDYTQMQGPAPSGYHVPLSSEWTAVKTIWTTLGGGGSDGTSFGVNLKLPMAGNRYYNYASVNYVGSHGRYWSSTPRSANYAYNLDFNSSGITPQDYFGLSYGFSVRCFKNSPVVPTSSWTKLYGTSIEAGGIFWNSNDGLISLSSNGTDWITMQDKNLGATTVWNSGNTLTDANCGNVFQRGNNYAFPGTKSSTTITTSSTKVDVTGYGPGNYYSSSTWITVNPRNSTTNDNLWGGVTGVKPMSELKNAYIGEVIECDFTKSDYGFTYSTSNPYVSTYGQSSNGLGVTNKTTTGRGAVSWTIPTRATGKIFKKAELIFTGTPAGYGCGLAVGVDTKIIRLLQALRVVWGTQNTTSANVATAANSEIKIIIDLENKTLSSNVNSTTATLTDNAISAFTTDRLAGNVKLSVITMDTASSKSYCKKLILSY